MKPDPQKLKGTYGVATSKNKKKELQAFPGMIYYLSKFFPSTSHICESLTQPEIMQNRMDLECNIPETI